MSRAYKSRAYKSHAEQSTVTVSRAYKSNAGESTPSRATRCPQVILIIILMVIQGMIIILFLGWRMIVIELIIIMSYASLFIFVGFEIFIVVVCGDFGCAFSERFLYPMVCCHSSLDVPLVSQNSTLGIYVDCRVFYHNFMPCKLGRGFSSHCCTGRIGSRWLWL